MSVQQPNAVAENEAVAARLKDMDGRAVQQPCSYRVLFDEARELAEQQFKRAMVAEAALSRCRTIVDKQAEDQGLWFQPRCITEVYLQQEIRRLHVAIEGKTETDCAIAALSKD